MKIKKTNLINFSSPRLRPIKVSSFTSGLVQYRSSQEIGDSQRAVTLTQESLVSRFLYCSVEEKWKLTAFLVISLSN